SSAAAARPAGGLRADYGFVAMMDREITRDPEREREFKTRVRQDTDEIYMRLDDEQTERQLLAGRLNMLETEARMSREAWVRSTDASDLVRGEVMSLRTTVLGQMSEIRELQAANRKRQTKQMAPKQTTRSTADQETINATSITNAQLQAMIDPGVTAALVARDALRSTNGDDSHNFGTCVRMTEQATRECTYTDFLKCQPLPFKGTEGVAKAIQKGMKIQVKKAFENADLSSRVELIPSRIKYAIKVVLSFQIEFSVFLSLSRKENDGLLQRSSVQE
nr:hypothetical protein [Tanacetum cinerariifolium]